MANRETRNIVFIYSKDNKIKVFDLIDSQNRQIIEKITNEGWVHTSTLDSNVYLEYLINECEDIVESLNELKVKNK